MKIRFILRFGCLDSTDRRLQSLPPLTANQNRSSPTIMLT